MIFVNKNCLCPAPKTSKVLYMGYKIRNVFFTY